MIKNKVLNLIMILLFSTIAFAQEQEVDNKEKAVVYFVRASGLGSMINFTYFDGDKVIGQFKGQNYMVYECDPGKHLLWARSENKFYVEAELEAGKTYLIDVIPQMGGIKAGVKLVPVDVKNYFLKKVQKLVTKKDPIKLKDTQLENLQTKMSDVIERGLEKYEKMKEYDIPQLKIDMTIEEEDLVYSKKKKK